MALPSPRRVLGLRVELPAWGTSEDPPRAFRLFSYGPNSSTKGTFYLDRAVAEALVASAKGREIAKAADYEHAALDAPATGAPASAWFSLDARADGLWAVDVEWTERAKEYLRKREYRYFSPTFDVEPDAQGQEHITGFLNFALTNWPALDNQRPLVASEISLQDGQHARGALVLQTIVIAKSRAKTLEEARPLAKKYGTDEKVDETEDSYRFRQRPPEHFQDGSFRTISQEAGVSLVLGKLKQQYLAQMGNEMEKEYYDMLVKLLTDAGLAVSEELSAKLMGLVKEWLAKMMAPADAPSTEDVQVLAAAREVTGQRAATQVIGALKALAQSRKDAVGLSQKIATLETWQAKREEGDEQASRTSLVEEGIRAFKIPPAAKTYWLSQPSAQIKAALEVLPVLGGSAVALPPPPPGTAGSAIVSLSQEDRHAIKLLGVSEESFLKRRQEELARAQQRR